MKQKKNQPNNPTMLHRIHSPRINQTLSATEEVFKGMQNQVQYTTQVQLMMVTEKNFKEILKNSKLEEFKFKTGQLEELSSIVRSKKMVLKSRSLHGSLTSEETKDYFETPIELQMQLPTNYDLLNAVTIRQPRMQQLDTLRAANCVSQNTITKFDPQFEYQPYSGLTWLPLIAEVLRLYFIHCDVYQKCKENKTSNVWFQARVYDGQVFIRMPHFNAMNFCDLATSLPDDPEDKILLQLHIESFPTFVVLFV